MPATILVVHSNASVLAEVSATLHAAGYEVSEASTFEQAKALLDRRAPDLLIAGVRLGAFNGLHLVVRGRSKNARMAAVAVADPADRVLSAEASRLGAVFVVEPLRKEALLAMVARALDPSLT